MHSAEAPLLKQTAANSLLTMGTVLGYVIKRCVTQETIEVVYAMHALSVSECHAETQSRGSPTPWEPCMWLRCFWVS